MARIAQWVNLASSARAYGDCESIRIDDAAIGQADTNWSLDEQGAICRDPDFSDVFTAHRLIA